MQIYLYSLQKVLLRAILRLWKLRLVYLRLRSLVYHLYLAGGREIYLEPMLLLCRFILLLARLRYFGGPRNFWKLGRSWLHLLNLRGRRARVRELLPTYVLLYECTDLVVCYLAALIVHRRVVQYRIVLHLVEVLGGERNLAGLDGLLYLLTESLRLAQKRLHVLLDVLYVWVWNVAQVFDVQHAAICLRLWLFVLAIVFLLFVA